MEIKDQNIEKIPIDDYTKKWVSGNLSNFDYLKIVNQYADRTTSDLSHYPVFPWVLSDYKSDQINLTD